MAKADTRTGLDKFREELETKQNRRISENNLKEAFDKVYTKASNNPEAKTALEDALKPGGSLSVVNKAIIGQYLFRIEAREAALSSPEIARTSDLNRKSQFAGLLTYASAANSAINVISRVVLGAGAFNAQVSGRVIEFENQQRTWENIRRSVLLAGSIGSAAKVTASALAGAAAGATIFAVGAATVAQGARIFNENRQLSGERQRQDRDSQYHQMTYGRIITRGNR
jgi:hypothetical protein